MDSAPPLEVTCAIVGRDNGAVQRAACRVYEGGRRITTEASMLPATSFAI